MVVLIIGILAAVALPQYQVAVEKSRLTQQIALVSSIVKAQKLYYMANGRFANDLADLDSGAPDSCTFPDAGDRSWVRCGKFSIGYMHKGTNCLVYGTNDPSWTGGTLRYEKRMIVGGCTGEAFCYAKTGDDTAQRVSQSMGGADPAVNAFFSGFTRYTLPN